MSFLSAAISLNAQTVVDVGLQSKFQDTWGGHLKRGRAGIAADFDLDGRIDFYIGNPGDESFVIRNRPSGGGFVFELVQVLVKGELAWGAAASDYDNDGDYDIFITTGANEGVGFDFLFKNLWLETGQLRFMDVSNAAGIRGPVPPGETEPIPVASANAVWGDYDQDGDNDLFVSVNARGDAIPPGFLGRNILWENNGDGTFTDVTDAVGLGVTHRATRHSTFLDFDNDSDLDLFENNYGYSNVLWRNLLVETGSANFEDVTAAMSLPGEDLSYPLNSFVSASADFNNDGFQDIITFTRGEELTTSSFAADCGSPSRRVGRAETLAVSPYGSGHAIFLNVNGTGFKNVAATAELNNPFQPVLGVMGCQVGDLNGDGIPDVYIGNGGPEAGQYDQFFLSDGLIGGVPHYVNRTDLIDFPAPQSPGAPPGFYPPYPYRTHGTCFVDVDNDGVLEISVVNGGPAAKPVSVREPNRLFRIRWPAPFSHFKVRPVGDGVAVSRDAVGTRMAVTVRNASGATWTVRNTLFAGSAFSAQNGFEVYFGLGDATTIDSLEVRWPDGTIELITEGLAVNSSIVVEYQQGVVANAAFIPNPAQATPEPMLGENFPNPFNPETWIPYELPAAAEVTLVIHNSTGQVIRTLEVGHRPAGVYRTKEKAIYWDGRNHFGERASSGVYFYTLIADDFQTTRKMAILK